MMLRDVVIFMVLCLSPAIMHGGPAKWHTYSDSARTKAKKAPTVYMPADSVPTDPTKVRWQVADSQEKGKNQEINLYVRQQDGSMAVVSAKKIAVGTTINPEFVDVYNHTNYYGFKMPGTEQKQDAEVFWMSGRNLKADTLIGPQ